MTDKTNDGGPVLLECRGCGSIKTRAELDAGGWVNCCPERAMNEVIEQRHGVPALLAARAKGGDA